MMQCKNKASKLPHGNRCKHQLFATNSAYQKTLLLCCFFAGAGPYQNIFTASEFTIFYSMPYQTKNYEALWIFSLAVFIGIILFPLIGTASDIFFGRYKSIVCSVGIMFCGETVIAAGLLIANIEFDHIFTIGRIYCVIILLLIFWASFPGFLAIIPFGADQLYEAPSADICKWVRWSTWLILMGRLCSDALLRSCLMCLGSRKILTVTILCVYEALIALGLFLVLVILVKKRNQFVIEPCSSSPYKTILQVLNFARKHKNPIRRSALTFWDDEQPSRLDLAKDKYGGPFTNEQVEDVKTFLQIVGVLLAMTLWFGQGEFTAAETDIMYLHTDYHLGTSLTKHSCTVESFLAVSNVVPYLVTTTLFIVYELCLRPVVGNYLPGTLKSYGIGLLLSYIPTLVFFTIDTVGHSLHPNATCMFWLYDIRTNFTITPPPTLDISAFTLVPVSVISTTAHVICTVSAHQFIFAQSPYHMRGAILGLYYFLKMLFFSCGGSAIVLLYFVYRSRTITSPLNCGFGYFCAGVVLAVVSLVIYCVVVKKYKHRQRDDPVNQHIYQFAENYYGT